MGDAFGDEAADIYNMPPEQHLREAAELATADVDPGGYALRHAAVQGHLLWAIAKATPGTRWKPDPNGGQ